MLKNCLLDSIIIDSIDNNIFNTYKNLSNKKLLINIDSKCINTEQFIESICRYLYCNNNKCKCDNCPICKNINNKFIYLDSTTTTIENLRTVLNQSLFVNWLLISEIEFILNKNIWNVLLKHLEENESLNITLIGDKLSLPSTILSRVYIIDIVNNIEILFSDIYGSNIIMNTLLEVYPLIEKYINSNDKNYQLSFIYFSYYKKLSNRLKYKSYVVSKIIIEIISLSISDILYVSFNRRETKLSTLISSRLNNDINIKDISNIEFREIFELFNMLFNVDYTKITNQSYLKAYFTYIDLKLRIIKVIEN